MDVTNLNSKTLLDPVNFAVVTPRVDDQQKPEQDTIASVEQTLETIDSTLERDEQELGDQTGDVDKQPPTLKKLIIQIPCYNEAGTLGITLDALPRSVAGVETVEWLIIDDGSVDETVEVAKAHGVDHVVSFARNKGLAYAFQAGIEACLSLGADVIVNTDADNQYEADDIENLVQPIVNGEADFVVGERPISDTAHFSFLKKKLQKLGSWVVRQASTAAVPDAPSGFRAIRRETAMRLNVFSEYTYTLETLIQAGRSNFAVTSVPIRTNEDLRPSRLLKSISSYCRRSAETILRAFMIYRPLYFFGVPAGALCLASLVLCVRYMIFFLSGSGGGHIQSLILASILMGAGLLCAVVGLIGDLISVNRKLLEKTNMRICELNEQVRRLNDSQSVSGRSKSSRLDLRKTR